MIEALWDVVLADGAATPRRTRCCALVAPMLGVNDRRFRTSPGKRVEARGA